MTRSRSERAFENKFPNKEQDLGIRYIEKFVQLEFELPPKTSPQVEEFFKAVAPPELKANEAVLKIVSEFIQPNPRKILRWLNRVIFIQELFRQGPSTSSFPQPETVPAWVFIKSFFPEFARLVEKDPSILRLAFHRAKGETSPEEDERLKEITTDKLLDDFLRSLNETTTNDPRLPEVIFQTKLTITESVSTLQPESMIVRVDGLTPEEVDSVADDLTTNSKAKALETAKLLGERLASIKIYPEYTAATNRVRFLKRILSMTASEPEKRTLYDVLINILKSLNGQSFWDYTSEMKTLLAVQNIHRYAIENGHIDIFIANLIDATFWDYAGQFSEILLPFASELTQAQANRIASAALSNNQVYGSFRARPDLTKILLTNEDAINTDIWKRLLEERSKDFRLTN